METSFKQAMLKGTKKKNLYSYHSIRRRREHFLMRNVLEWIRNNRSRSKGDNLPKAGFSELLNILLNNFVSVAFKNPTNKTSILLKTGVVRTKITFKGENGAPSIVSNIQTARQNLF